MCCLALRLLYRFGGGVSHITLAHNNVSFKRQRDSGYRKIASYLHSVFSKVLDACKVNLITARARKDKRTACMSAKARKDHSIPLITRSKLVAQKIRKSAPVFVKLLVSCPHVSIHHPSLIPYHSDCSLSLPQYLTLTCHIVTNPLSPTIHTHFSPNVSHPILVSKP